MQRAQDLQVVSLLKMADQETVEWWFRTYKPRILRFVTQRVAAPEDSEEIVQHTFMNCLKNLALFSGNSSLETWMLAIAKHEVADFYRRRYAKKVLKTTPLSVLVTDYAGEDAHDVSAKVLRVLKRMNVSSRELLLKKYVDSMKVTEIAQELNRTVKAIESDLFRARSQFKVLYAEDDA